MHTHEVGDDQLTKIMMGSVIALAVFALFWVNLLLATVVSAAVVMRLYFECHRLILRDTVARKSVQTPVQLLVISVVVLTASYNVMLAIWLLTLSSLCIVWWSKSTYSDMRWSHVGMLSVATLYIGLAGIFAVGLLNGSAAQREVLVGLILVAVATDIGAQFGGKAVGGYKLCPAISPHKTIAGAVSGICSAVVALLLYTSWLGVSLQAELVLSGIALSIVAQAGDLLESALKRWAGVDDSGGILPGHGGVADRLDSHLAVIVIGAPLFIW